MKLCKCFVKLHNSQAIICSVDLTTDFSGLTFTLFNTQNPKLLKMSEYRHHHTMPRTLNCDKSIGNGNAKKMCIANYFHNWRVNCEHFFQHFCLTAEHSHSLTIGRNIIARRTHTHLYNSRRCCGPTSIFYGSGYSYFKHKISIKNI